MKVKFSDVVRRANTKEDKDNTDKVFYVGGEHIDSNEVLITKRGIIAGSTIGPMFYFGFKAGQVLFVSRNPHLRKAGMVDFDGICSEKTFVLETIDENILLQRYLPFILQSDHFWSYAESNKSGSVNFFINWSTLAKYEFELPSIAKQKELSDLLWAINDTKLAYRKMLIATDELVKSQFIALFGDQNHENTQRTEYTLQELIDRGWITYHLDGNHGGQYPRSDEFVSSGVPYISANCIVNGYVDFSKAKFVTTERAKQFRKGIAQNRDVLFAHNATVGPVALLSTEKTTVILGTSLTAFRCDPAHIIPEYLKVFMECEYFIKQYAAEMQQTTRKQVPITTQRKYSFIIPEIALQNRYAYFVQQSDKSKFAALNISNLNLSLCLASI